jgi:hypothetical protein
MNKLILFLLLVFVPLYLLFPCAIPQREIALYTLAVDFHLICKL